MAHENGVQQARCAHQQAPGPQTPASRPKTQDGNALEEKKKEKDERIWETNQLPKVRIEWQGYGGSALVKVMRRDGISGRAYSLRTGYLSHPSSFIMLVSAFLSSLWQNHCRSGHDGSNT